MPFHDCRSMKWLVGNVAAFLICVFIYAETAFVSVLGLVSAVRSVDAAEVMARTNLPRIRHSIVDQPQFLVRAAHGNDPGRPGAGAGSAGAARRATEAAGRCDLPSCDNWLEYQI